MNFRLLITALCLLASALCASAEQMTLRLAEILPLANALASLDAGQTKIVKQPGDAGDKVVQLPYEFSGATRWIIARDLGALKREVEAFDKAKADLIKQISGGGTSIDPAKEPKQYASFVAELQPVVDAPVKIDLQRLKPDDLKLDVNPIPSTTLVALEPILIQ